MANRNSRHLPVELVFVAWNIHEHNHAQIFSDIFKRITNSFIFYTPAEATHNVEWKQNNIHVDQK